MKWKVKMFWSLLSSLLSKTAYDQFDQVSSWLLEVINKITEIEVDRPHKKPVNKFGFHKKN